MRVEFASGAEAVARELREEIEAEVEAPVHRTTIENVFTHEVQHGHEICLVYDVTLLHPPFDDRTAWDAPVEHGIILRVLWKPLADFGAGARLYPDGVLPLLDG